MSWRACAIPTYAESTMWASWERRVLCHGTPGSDIASPDRLQKGPIELSEALTDWNGAGQRAGRSASAGRRPSRRKAGKYCADPQRPEPGGFRHCGPCHRRGRRARWNAAVHGSGTGAGSLRPSLRRFFFARRSVARDGRAASLPLTQKSPVFTVSENDPESGDESVSVAITLMIWLPTPGRPYPI